MMASKGFHPTEVLFSITTECNLSCGHCDKKITRNRLSLACAASFLSGCKPLGVKRVGFTGGEPFLALNLLCALTTEGLRQGFLFDRVMTNAVWWRSESDLISALDRLFYSGYDGSICVSVDAFHKQNIKKVARFIELAVSIWRRPDMVSIAYVRGAKDRETELKIAKLMSIVKKAPVQIFLRKLGIDIAPIGDAVKLKDPWDGEWFREDYCRGPGNVFFVMPNGAVKPCCGYAADRRDLVIGDIRRDSGDDIMKNFKKNRFVRTIFNQGLSKIRSRLERAGVSFPGKTSSHCYFCNYILTKIPRSILFRSLSVFLLAFFLISQQVSAREIRMGKECREISANIVKKVKIPSWYHEGLFYDGKSLWLSNGEKGNVWLVDMETGALASQIEGVSDFTEALIRTEDGSLYTTEWYTKKIYRVKLDGTRLVPEREASFRPAHPTGLVSAGKRLFVVTWTRGIGTQFHIVEMDMDLKAVDRVLIKDIREPDQLAWDGKDLWISCWWGQAVYRVDIDRWEITGYFKSPVAKTTGIAWDGKYMWVTGTYGDLYKLELGS